MVTEPKVLYEFGPFRVDPEKQVLLREEHPVAISPKVFETLLILVRRSREVVSKEDLMQALWPDAFVEEANLSQNIFMLRKALGDTPESSALHSDASRTRLSFRGTGADGHAGRRRRGYREPLSRSDGC